MEEYNVWRIIGMVVCALYIAWTIVSLIVSRVKAKNIGILCVKYPTSPALFSGALLLSLLMWGSFFYFAARYHQNSSYINDMEVRGITAVAERQNKSVDELLSGAEFIGGESYEDIYVEREIASYTRLVEQERAYLLSAGIGSVMVTLIVLSSSGAYITRSGGMSLTSFRPQKTAAKIENGRICFYNEKKPGKIWAKFPASEDNKERFKSFIIP